MDGYKYAHKEMKEEMKKLSASIAGRKQGSNSGYVVSVAVMLLREKELIK